MFRLLTPSRRSLAALWSLATRRVGLDTAWSDTLSGRYISIGCVACPFYASLVSNKLCFSRLITAPYVYVTQSTLWQLGKELTSNSTQFMNLVQDEYYGVSGWPDLGPKWVRLASNGTNPGIFSGQIEYTLALLIDCDKRTECWGEFSLLISNF